MDLCDAAQALTERERETALTRLRRQAAADRAAPGSGVCVDCGEPIPAARLAALPGTRLCVACAAARAH